MAGRPHRSSPFTSLAPELPVQTPSSSSQFERDPMRMSGNLAFSRRTPSSLLISSAFDAHTAPTCFPIKLTPVLLRRVFVQLRLSCGTLLNEGEWCGTESFRISRISTITEHQSIWPQAWCRPPPLEISSHKAKDGRDRPQEEVRWWFEWLSVVEKERLWLLAQTGRIGTI